MQRLVWSAVLFLLVVASGVWLGVSGKEYGTGLLTVHKLLAIAMVILSGMVIRDFLREAEASSLYVILSVVGGLSVIALFATGGLLSAGKAPYALLRLVHIITTISAVGSVSYLFRHIGLLGR